MMYNVAIIGTFDLENFGDLMFPIVFKNQLKKRVDIENLFLFSPNECQMPLNPDNLKVYSIDKLEEIHNQFGLDAIVFGGGDLVRLDTEFAPKDKYATQNTPFDMMVYSAVIANKYGIPCLWNCPGVPFEFSSDEKKIMKCLIDDFVDYVSVREECSAEMLNACGCEKKVNVSPDTVLSISKLIDKNENGIFENLKEEFSFLNSSYIVFQAWINNIENFDEEIKNQLDAISRKSDKKIVFLAIGNVHKDDEHIEQMLAAYKNDNFVTFNRKLNIYETNAVLGNASAFIGTSLHGNIVSNSYGVPSIGLNLFDFVKLKNYFKLVSRSEYCVKDIAEIEKTYFDMMTKNTTKQIDAIASNIENHFDIIAENIGKKPNEKGDIKQLLNACYYLEKADKDNCVTVFFDCGNGFTADNREVINLEKNYEKISLNINLPKDTKRVRIDPLDNAYCALSNVRITANGKQLKFSGNFVVADDNSSYLLFLNNDPQMVVSVDSSICELNVEFNVFGLHLRNNASNNQEADKAIHVLESQILSQKETIFNKDKVIAEKDLTINNKDKIIQQKESEIEEINQIIQNKNLIIADYDRRYNEVMNSFYWRLTAMPRKITQKIRNIISQHKKIMFLFVFAKGFLRGGFKGAKTQLQNYKEFKGIHNAVSPSASARKERKFCAITDEVRQYQQEYKFSKNIKFSILVPLYNTPKDFLIQMINSVREQTYQNWELCLADGSTDNYGYVEKMCLNYAKKDSRIVYKKLEENRGISENTNACLEMATGDYIALFDHDDVLEATVLFEYMKAICEQNADFIYCDEDKFNKFGGRLYDENYKPDFAIDNLRSNNYICHFTVFDKKLIDKAGTFRKEFDGSQDHDLILRLTEQAKNIVHIPKVLYHWRVSDASVASDPYAKPYTIEAGRKAVAEHLERSGLKGTVESTKIHPNIYRIKYDIIGNPLVSIIIPNYNHVEELSRCIDSIINKSTYKNYEIIIVENNSNKKTFAYYDTLKKYNNIKVVVYESNSGFNYSAINNYGVQFAKGEHYILLNNDIEIITPNWIEEMLMYSQRDDVGAVGAMLYYPNDTIQHAGVTLGVLTLAGHNFKHFPRGNPGYFGRAGYQQNVSAVTAACLMVSAKVYKQVNGLDESFAVAFNDIDFCMRIRKEGYLIAFTPFAELYHYESISRGSDEEGEKRERFVSEIERFQARWKPELENGDPYYNPNLTLDREDFSIK